MEMSGPSSSTTRLDLPETTAAARAVGPDAAASPGPSGDTQAAGVSKESRESEAARQSVSAEAAPTAHAPVETQFDRAVDGPASDRVAAMPGKTVRQRLRRPLMFALPIVLAGFGAAYYLVEAPYVSTNDAFVRAAKITLNARVAGQAVEIAVRDNQLVRQGQVLFRIDPEPYQIAVDQAEARLASARLQIDGFKATYRQQQNELQSAQVRPPMTSASTSARRR
jgi:membrane fusion protein (multidrug efflux system)